MFSTAVIVVSDPVNMSLDIMNKNISIHKIAEKPLEKLRSSWTWWKIISNQPEMVKDNNPQ